MPGTITVREVLRRVSSTLMDSDPQFTRYTEREMVDFLNDAQRAIHKYLPASCSRVDAVRLKPGTLQSIESIPAAFCKPGDGSTPAVPIIGSMLLDVICNMGADGTVPGRAVRPIPDGRETLDALDPAWHSADGATAITGYMYDPKAPRHFHVTPPVHASTQVWVRMSYVAAPLAIPNTGTPESPVFHASGASTLAISVHDEHVDDLHDYMCARLLMKNSQFAASTGMSAASFVALFTSSINAKAATITGNNPNLKKLPFAPEPIGSAS